jgi:DNA end-binding protein Ku
VIGPQYFEKPYVLVPARKAEKGYVLLRETLKKTGKIGIARVVIRTREHLCAVLPQEDALMLVMMRYPQELVDVDDYALPEGKSGDYRINANELKMAEQLIGSMESDWKPNAYKDEFRARLQAVIEKRIKAKGGTVPKPDEEEQLEHDATTNVVDFMSLLQESIDAKKRTPARKTAKKAARKTTKKAAKKPARKTAKKATKRKSA